MSTNICWAFAVSASRDRDRHTLFPTHAFLSSLKEVQPVPDAPAEVEKSEGSLAQTNNTAYPFSCSQVKFYLFSPLLLTFKLSVLSKALFANWLRVLSRVICRIPGRSAVAKRDGILQTGRPDVLTHGEVKAKILLRCQSKLHLFLVPVVVGYCKKKSSVFLAFWIVFISHKPSIVSRFHWAVNLRLRFLQETFQNFLSGEINKKSREKVL